MILSDDNLLHKILQEKTRMTAKKLYLQSAGGQVHPTLKTMEESCHFNEDTFVGCWRYLRWPTKVSSCFFPDFTLFYWVKQVFFLNNAPKEKKRNNCLAVQIKMRIFARKCIKLNYKRQKRYSTTNSNHTSTNWWSGSAIRSWGASKLWVVYEPLRGREESRRGYSWKEVCRAV